ncbi:hypothetical protein [Halobacterium yunchengense]|uniref:hypothetical protein n=1 Tax=Halobacterium yunchengense TaxID=3108497 RepID=UPI003009AD5F
MGSSIPEEGVKQFVEEQVEEIISEVEQAVQEYQKQQLAVKFEELTQDVQSELEGRNVDTSRANTREVVQENLLETISGTERLEGRTIEIPVGGRANKRESTKMKLTDRDPPTKTIEVPIEGGDVENPETVEKEVIDPDMSDARLSEGMSTEEVARLNEYGEGDEDEGEKSRADDVPEGGFPWYQ